MRKARSDYVKDVKKSVTPQDEEEKENIKVHLGIYGRKTSASVAKEINKVDEDLKKAEEAVNALLEAPATHCGIRSRTVSWKQYFKYHNW